MTAVTGNHDTLVRRLALILVKLNQGEKLCPVNLAAEFNVNLRTIQRDLNERFSYLPLEKIQGKYQLNPAFLGKLTIKDINRFAGLAGVSGLFPALTEDFLREIFDSRIQSALLVKGHNYEDLHGREEAFKKIEYAIIARRRIRFEYLSGDIVKQYEVDPYKLINLKGIWYVGVSHLNKIKTFSFSKISKLEILDVTFIYDAEIEIRFANEDGVWLSEQRIKILLQVNKAAAPYFKRRKLMANQVIEQELEDGSLIVSSVVGHHNQIAPIVRYWIPHIRVISPSALQDEIDMVLRRYLSGE